MAKVENIDFKYEYITDEEKKKIVEVQLKDLEVAHFSLTMTEPSRLNQSQEHMQWRQQKTFIETQIKKIKNKREQLFKETSGSQ